jgi:hypothetical protein
MTTLITRIQMTLYVLAFLADCGWAAERFTVTGVIENHPPLVLRGKEMRLGREFTVTVDGCRWFMRLHDASIPNIQYEEVIYDGTNCVFTRVTRKEAVSPNSANNASANVTSGPVPNPNAPGFSGYLWLVYASECYLGGITDGRVPPVWPVVDKVQVAKYFPATERSFSTGVPMIPSQMRFYLDDTLDFQSPRLIHDLRQAAKDAPSISQKRIWSEMIVTDWFSESGLRLPRVFEFTQYNNNIDKDGKVLRKKAYTVRGRATNFAIGKAAEQVPDRWTPPPGARVAVDDYRSELAAKETAIPVSYLSTNRELLDTNSPRYAALAARSKAVAEMTAADPRASSKWLKTVFILFAVLSGAFTAYFVFGKRTARK